jgi:SAM-dependent methyltransferase
MLRRWAAAALLSLAGAAQGQAQDEVPFVVTPDNVTLAMLQLAQVGPQDMVYDLGSGDGRIVINAARRFGARGLGVELSPQLVDLSRANAAKAGVADRARFVEQDLFKTDLSPATVITMYLLQEVNLQLRPSLLALRPGTRIVSHDWDLGDWRPDRSLTVAAPDKPVGLDKRSRLHLWVVPARLAGSWCSGSARLQLAQRYQVFEATLALDDSALLLAGRIDGTRLQAAGGLEAAFDGGRLRITRAGSAPPALQGAEFERCAG